MGISARVRLNKAELDGEIMHQGQRAHFKAWINGPKVSAEFTKHSESERDLDEWELFRLLESFIDRHCRG